MSTIGTKYVTYLDFARRATENFKVEKEIVELLAQTNEILDDMVMIEGNLPTGHKTTIRTGLPTATWRMLNYGVKQSKSQTTQITDACGMLEAYAEVDKSLADLNGNDNEWRLSEEMAFIEALNINMASTLFNGDTAAYPERFLGLMKRYNNTDTTKAASAENVIDCGGSTNLTSMYLVVWGKRTVHSIYPKGSKVGISFENKGQVTLDDADGGHYEGYRSHYKWDLGLTVRDWRYVVRLANIDTVALATAGDSSDTSANLLKLMTIAMNKIPNLKSGTPAFYCNNLVKTYLEVKCINANKMLTMTDLTEGSGTLTRYRGIPIRRVDQITNAETRVTSST